MSQMFPVAGVTSQPRPQEGQEHRSSGNFSYQNLPENTVAIQFAIDTETEPADYIVFDVMEDRSLRRDEVIYQNVGNGSQFPVEGVDRSLYIANPRNANGDFYVQVLAITE